MEASMDDVIEQPRVEFAFMADRAYVDKTGLYVSGGALDIFYSQTYGPKEITWVFVVGILIPWSMAGQKVALRFRLEDEDGKIVGTPYMRDVWVNRTGYEEEGQPLRHVSAQEAQWPTPAPGTYAVVIRIDEGPERRVIFHLREPRDDAERAIMRPES
jgi:hypothetical protein